MEFLCFGGGGGGHFTENLSWRKLSRTSQTGTANSEQSQTSIRMSRGTGSLRVVSQGLPHPFLKEFRGRFS